MIFRDGVFKLWVNLDNKGNGSIVKCSSRDLTPCIWNSRFMLYVKLLRQYSLHNRENGVELRSWSNCLRLPDDAFVNYSMWVS